MTKNKAAGAGKRSIPQILAHATKNGITLLENVAISSGNKHWFTMRRLRALLQSGNIQYYKKQQRGVPFCSGETAMTAAHH
jgi:hypothetical protein